MVFTDCTLTGLKHIVAKKKIEAIVAGTEIVRAELRGESA
jgi:methionine synthase II (cobalamin-independent)